MPNRSIPHSQHTLDQVRKKTRKGLLKHGTDVNLNDADPYGDGDQSLIDTGGFARQQFYRDLYAYGGDMKYWEETGMAPLSQFGKHCIPGNVDEMRELLKEADTDPAKPSQALIQLLERRETTQRLSPLLLMVSTGKNSSWPEDFLLPRHCAAASLLLEYGARPDARDVCGKTVFHYGMGAFATSTSMAVAYCCSMAHASSHLFGKEVELHSLEDTKMNGLRGVCRGFDVKTSQRYVHVFDRQMTILFKPENLELVGEDAAADNERPKLCDIQDRLGGVALKEVLMRDRTDVAKVLIEEFDARIDLVDVEGLSPKSMAVQRGPLSLVGTMIMKSVMRHSRTEKTERENSCRRCGKVDTPLMKCGKCHSVNYCSKKCQMAHWKTGGHKQECKKLMEANLETVSLTKPPPGGMLRTIVSPANLIKKSSPEGKTEAEWFKKPSDMAYGEQFYVKIQGRGPPTELMIYDKTRQFQAYVEPSVSGYDELYAKVAADPNAGGCKTYLKCCFDGPESCTIFLATRSVKLW